MIYQGRGLTPELASEVATQLTAHDALGAHARDELGISEITTARPVQAALTSAVTFAFGAALPLVTALLAPLPHTASIVAATSLVFLGALGAIAARAGGAFADWVMATVPDFLAKRTTEDIEVRTTFDPRIQKAAEAGLSAVFDNKLKSGSNAQAAIVVMSPDGAVRAMVGGRELGAGEGEFNRATQAQRQTGSLFKPFVYAAALQAGANPFDPVLDAPLTIYVPGSGDWSPQNYSRDYLGQITLTEALANSINTATVRVSEETGRARVRAVAQDFGITTPIAEGPALALGVSEATLLQMTGAYAGFLNHGVKSTPYGLTSLRRKADGSALMQGGGEAPVRVLDDKAAGELVWMMEQVVDHGTGTRAQLPDGRPVAGKTGTTQAARDAWFIGFTADYVCGVWMGYDDNTPLKGTTGGGLPAEIWRETMTRVEDGMPASPLPDWTPERPVVAANVIPGAVNEVQTAVRNVVQGVLKGLFGRN